jgi:hypothetical protein
MTCCKLRDFLVGLALGFALGLCLPLLRQSSSPQQDSDPPRDTTVFASSWNRLQRFIQGSDESLSKTPTKVDPAKNPAQHATISKTNPQFQVQDFQPLRRLWRGLAFRGTYQ